MIVYTAFTFPTSHYFVHLSQGRDLYAFSYGGHGFNANLLYTTKMWWCHDSVLIWTSEEFKRYSGFHFVTLSYLTLTLKRSLKSLSTFFLQSILWRTLTWKAWVTSQWALSTPATCPHSRGKVKMSSSCLILLKRASFHLMVSAGSRLSIFE